MSSESSEISTLTPSQEDVDTEKGNNSDEAEEEGVEDQNVNANNEDVNGLALAETPEPVDPMVVEACMSPATPPAPQENEFDYEEEEDAIHLDHNDDMNYEEEGGNDDQEEEEDMSSFKPQNEEDYGNNASTPNDRFGELQGEDISAGESDEEDNEEIRETNFEVENKMNAAKEEEIDAGSDEDEEEGELENLEEGEIIDSDDGIPEIKGSMSPPEMADDFSKSFDNHTPAYDNTGNGGGGYPQQQHFDQQPQYEHREREQCRFYIRGNCRNGDACRFKHTFSTNARVQFQPRSNSARPSNYNIPVPPPTGPPIPLLSTEFAPPPSLALPIVRPSGPVNVDSAAWEQGLKKAREIVRRQQKTETKEEEEGKEEEEEDRKSEDLSFGGKGFEKAELANAEAEEPTSRHFHQQHRQQQYPSNVQQPNQNHHHRPIASRMVVEYVSVVTSPSVGGGSYGQRRSGNNDKSKVSIPSLIDNIIDKPMSPPPRERAPPMSLKTKQRDRDGRRTFESSNYSDPWARQNSSGGDYESGKRNGRTNSGRKRRRSSSAGSSSSSDGKPAKRRAHRTPSSPAHHHRQEDGRTNHHQHSTGQQSRHHNSSSRRVSNELPGRKETTSTERGEERKKIKEENDSGKAKLGRNDSASSRTSISSSKKKAFGQGKAPSSRSSSVSSTTSTSTDSSREATLGSLLKTHPTDKMTASQQSSSAKSKGPKTPPTPADLQRPSSESSTTASSSSCSRSQENRKKQSGNERPTSKHVDKSANIQSRQNSAKLDQQRRFSRGSNQSIKNDGKRRHSQQQQVSRRSSMLKNEEDEEEEDAPAAYRISRKPSSNADSKRKRGGGGDRESSTSSLSSSSSSSSDSSSNSSALGRDRKRKPSAGDGKTMVTICSSERNVRIPVPSLDDKVDPVSSDDDDAADERKNSLGGIAKQIVGITNTEDNEEAKGVNANVEDVERQMTTSASNIQKSSKEESSRKRKLELLQKLQSVEKAIARKKQQMDGGMEE